MAPKLQYEDSERDVALLRVETWEKRRTIYDLVDYRDMQTGRFAMNRTAGFTVAIGVLMILDGTITQCGVLSPVRHVPLQRFLREVKARGIGISNKLEATEGVEL